MEFNAETDDRITQRSSDKKSSILGSENSDLNASAFGVSFILLCMFVPVIALLLNSFLPKPVDTRGDTATSDRFVAGNAFKILEKLSFVGPKVVGTYENEVLAVDLIKEEIEKIIYSAHERRSLIEYDVQVVSGCYQLTVYKCYHNIQNIVVKFSSEAANGENILVNAHFDSVPASPGASDDGVNCVVMLEILRVLAASKKPLQKNVIFLFNGAEEDGLLGSHGFITQHRWAENITAFINLDACGAGGREILFQTGPNAVILPQVYAKYVPYPYGSVIGEELFQSGVLPSDTDFRIFRDFGKLKGVDLAHYRNGYVYHTSSDNISYVSESVIQHTGDNLLALLKAFIEVNLRSNIDDTPEQAVFFDVFGFFMLCYTMKTAFIVNLTVVLFSLITLTFVTIRIFTGRKLTLLIIHFSIDFLCTSAGFFMVTLVLHTLGEFVKWRGVTMLWYSNQWFGLAYYGIAALYTHASILRMRRDRIYSSLIAEHEAYLFIIIVQMVVTLFVFLCTLLQIRSIYFFDIGLVAVSTSHIIVNVVLKNAAIETKVIAYVVCNLIPVMYTSYLAAQFFHLIIPMLARTGVDMDSEMVVWILCEVLVILGMLYLIPLVILVKQWWKIELSIGVSYLLFVVAVLFGSVLSPFENGTPQRFDVLNVLSCLPFRPEDFTKLLFIYLDGAAFAHIFLLPLNNAQLVEWSVNSNLPESSTAWNNQTVFIIRYVRGLENVRRWSFWLKFNTSEMTSKSQVFKLAWSSEYRASETKHFTMNFQKLVSRFPLWTRVVSSVADHEEYVF